MNNYSLEPIRTKLIFEIAASRFLSLGFGNIAASTADIVCVSSYSEPYFVKNSAVGAIAERIARRSYHPRKGSLEDLANIWPKDMYNGDSKLIRMDRVKDCVDFSYLLVVCMGRAESRPANSVVNIQIGLSKATDLLQSAGDNIQIDVAALGTQYGGIDHHTAFDYLSKWALSLLQSTGNIIHVRLVAYDLDTFVDFYESLHRLKFQMVAGTVLSTSIDPNSYTDFRNDIASALQMLDHNPKQVITICRTVIEKVVKRVAKSKLKIEISKLVDGINRLKGFVPDPIFSYLQTCRVVGNFSVHDDSFVPTRRDAEGVLFLTLRIVEWFLSEKFE